MPKDKFDEKRDAVIAGCTELLKKYVAKEVAEDKLKDEVMKLNPRPKAKAAAKKAPAAATNHSALCEDLAIIPRPDVPWVADDTAAALEPPA